MTNKTRFLQRLRLKLKLTPKRTFQTLPVSLTRRRIYIVPNRSGFLFGLVLFVMLVGSINYSNSMGYVLTFLLFSMALISTLYTQHNLLNLAITLGKVEPVFVGETAQFQLWIDNRQRPERYALCWQRTPEQIGEEVGKPMIIDISANERIAITTPVIAQQRGRLFLDKITISTCFPLGLFYAWSYIYVDMSTIVYPAPTGQRLLPIGGEANQKGEAGLEVGQGDDFVGYRDYRMGDSPRHIDWKAVAREKGWLIKQYGGSGYTHHWLRWTDVIQINALEKKLSQLCLWVLIADSEGAVYGLDLPHVKIPPNNGAQHRDNCLKALALFGLPQHD
ncbi:DUF58 domain-containing protein [Beggiatoa leptomitoformis]|uniref:DUF58 domain-containing protein n=1 Tax=Beggiatoa leptomitoformis TaxID=288004 RepID=A0A2N9YA74_9GAMM|nr:DUF58 domain-containing protein [Beggiatoa leptomitoformis]ALG69340.2 DUF58 domain-containing protein [Beggiatoa leptomitoformis]AUI67361.1 DUF58 domain-containing protein [Beggiatoa leptomitoformis]